MWHGLQAGASKQGQERIYKLIEEIKDNFGFRQLQISAALNHNSLQLFIDGRPFALQELGAGLAQFIVVLGNAALKKPSFILIDEPEISLHPSLQLKFLMKLADTPPRAWSSPRTISGWPDRWLRRSTRFQRPLREAR